MAARELRYEWFTELASQLDFDYILTAHHADDNLETFLINFTRGTGLEGLTGIPEVNGKFVRPLLPFSSAAITAYAKTNGISWRDDSSNASAKYLRNKLRHELVPILKTINPSLLQSFQSTLENLKATADIVAESTNAVLKRAIHHIDETHIAFKVSEFKKVNNPKAYLFEVFKAYGFTEWEDMVALLDAETGKQLFSNTHRLIKNREELLLTDLPKVTKQTTLEIAEAMVPLDTPLGRLSITPVNTLPETYDNRTTVYVDKATLNFPLVLRQKQEGDVFYPLGMKGKKKLSKYFKDEKYSLLDKENAWVLCSGTVIVWLVGKRADARFRVTKATQSIVAIQLK
jgi:tRNA(Ile)-lysidine synthase